MCHQHLAYAALGAEPRASCMLSKHSTNETAPPEHPHTHTHFMDEETEAHGALTQGQSEEQTKALALNHWGGSPCSPGCPGTHRVDQAGPRLIEIQLPLLPKCWG